MFALLILGGVNLYAGKTYWNPEGWVASWNNETNTMSWNGSDYYKVMRTHLPTSELSVDTKIHVTVSNITGENDYIQLKIVSTGKPELMINLVEGENVIVFEDYSNNINWEAVTEITLWGTGSQNGSAVVTDFYMIKPAALNFDATGKAETNLADLYTTGGLSFNSTTGELTTDGTAGSLVLELATPVSMEYLRNLSITKDGDADIIDKMTYFNVDGTENQSWSWYKWGGDNNESAIGKFKGKPIKKIAWVSNAGKATDWKVTISSIIWQMNMLSVRTPNETLVAKSMYKRWSDGTDASTEVPEEGFNPNLNLNKTIDGTFFGFGTPEATAYMKLAGYQRILLEGPAGGNIRLFFNATGSQESERITIYKTFDDNGKIDLVFANEASLNSQEYVHLNSIKSQWGQTAQVDRIAFYKDVPDADGEYDYIIEGNGFANARIQNALNDVTAKVIKATGVTAATSLPTANPNCLIVANAGMVTNAQNVIVNGTCANLVLTDNYPFKAPADFTATSASYTTTINTTAQAGTLCLPFAATLPEGVTAYALEYTSGDEATATPVNGSVTANTPVLINGSGEVEFTGANVPVVADATNIHEAMTGVFEETYAPVGTYVLQNGSEGVGFYKVATNDIKVKPFRAYLNVQSNLAALRIVYPGDVTGIEAVEKAADSKDDAYYTLSGVRVSHPVKGLYIKNGKKVMVK